MLAATLPAGFTESSVGGGINSGTAMAVMPGNRLLVCEQTGRLRVIKNNAILATPFATLPVNATGERGLLGVAVDPDFASNSYVYVYYTANTSPLHHRVVRFTANGDVAAGAETLIFRLDDLNSATNHNGGAMHFGADGKLYLATGDNTTGSNSQSLSNLFGKILRINKDGSIPSDNPFANATGQNRAIWAMGLRNPYTFAFQPDGDRRMLINDVGQNTWEEINPGRAGANYGWPATEGAFNAAQHPNFTNPLFTYGHGGTATTGCAITGGVFYPAGGSFPPEYHGKYFFADYCSGWIRVLDPATGQAAGFATGAARPIDLKVGPDGALYYLAQGASAVYRVAYSTPAPVITQQPQSITRVVNKAASFRVTASGAAPLSYQWQRNGADIPNATSAVYNIAQVPLQDSGVRFRARVRNATGEAFSNEATLTVTPAVNQPPVPQILTPAIGTLYAGGTNVSFSATASDPEDGPLPASAFTWSVVFHHAGHTHPFLPSLEGTRTGTMSIPNRGETAVDVFYRITLTVRDSAGRTATVTRDVLPLVVTLRIVSNQTRVRATVDGQPVITPVNFPSVAGMIRELGAPLRQKVGAAIVRFDGWSNGGALVHEIATPVANATYTVNYR